MKLQERLEKLRREADAGSWEERNEIALPLAEAADTGEWLTLRIDDTDGGHCHFSAEQGEGRSALMHQLLLELLYGYGPQRVRVCYLGDHGGAYKELSELGAQCFPLSEAEAFSSRLIAQLEERRDTLIHNNAENYRAYCFRGTTGVAQYHFMPRLVILAEDAPLFGGAGTLSRQISVKGRSLGVTMLTVGTNGSALPNVRLAVIDPPEKGAPYARLRMEEDGAQRCGRLPLPTAEELEESLRMLHEQSALRRRTLAGQEEFTRVYIRKKVPGDAADAAEKTRIYNIGGK